MVQNGFVDPASAAQVDPATIAIQPTTKQNSVRYFTDWALPQLDALIDESSEPIEVWTTLDPNMQAAADRAIAANAPANAQGALVAMDRDGAVRAMVGGRDYVSSIYNRATQAERQPGSAFKLFVYLAALESGMKPTDTLVDEPVTIDGWTPRNATRTNIGPVELREAFARSINTISAKIGAQVGFGTIADMARRFGISSKISTFPSMVLGTSEVRLIDMTRAFASVANQGVAVQPYAIRRVVTADGRQLYAHDAEEGRVLVAPWVAAEMTDLLQTAVMTGTGRAAQIGRPVAGKTGTTSSNKDGWFIGFSSGLTTGVWMGRDDARPIAGLQGGTAPARAFHDFMSVAVAKRPVEQFQTQVPIPDWDLGDDGAEYATDNQVGFEPLVDENGNPLPNQPTDNAPPPETQQPQGGQVDQQWLDQVLPPNGQRSNQPVRTAPPQPQVVRPQPTQPQPRSVRPPDPLEPAPDTPQQ
jgi:penicillin-binding protein 1A